MVERIPVTLRYVVIPGITDSAEDIQSLMDLIHSLPKPVPVELLAYHTYGRQKWQDLKMKYTLENIPEATPEDVNLVAHALIEQNILVLNHSEDTSVTPHSRITTP